MESERPQWRLVLSIYQRTTVAPIYPGVQMMTAALTNDYEIAALTAEVLARKFGCVYLLDANRHHVAQAWVRRPHESEVELFKAELLHKHGPLRPSDEPTDPTRTLATLGGNCPHCRSLLDALPTPADQRHGE